MTRPARSLFIFGWYVIVVGAAFVAAPDALMTLLRLPPATAGWGRTVGLLAIVIGSYDTVAARAESLRYLRASVPIRFGFAAGTALLVLFSEMPATILVLGASDIAGALWTWAELKSAKP